MEDEPGQTLTKVYCATWNTSVKAINKVIVLDMNRMA